MKIRPLAIEGAYEVTPVLHGDPRGVFSEWYRADLQRKAATAQTLALRANAAHQKKNYVLAPVLAALSLQVRPTQEAKDAAINLFARQAFVRLSRSCLGPLCVSSCG